jgi:hypothetical protein
LRAYCFLPLGKATPPFPCSEPAFHPAYNPQQQRKPQLPFPETLQNLRANFITPPLPPSTKNGQPLPASAVSTLGTAVCAAGATNLTVVVASAAECASPVIVTFPEFVRPAVKLELIGQATIALAEQVGCSLGRTGGLRRDSGECDARVYPTRACGRVQNPLARVLTPSPRKIKAT